MSSSFAEYFFKIIDFSSNKINTQLLLTADSNVSPDVVFATLGSNKEHFLISIITMEFSSNTYKINGNLRTH